MPEINLADLSTAIHQRCNAFYYAHLLDNLQRQVALLGIEFNQCESSTNFENLCGQLVLKITILMSINSHSYLNPRLSREQAFRVVMHELESGYSERLTSDIFKALQLGFNIYIHLDPTYTNEPIKDISGFVREHINCVFKERTPYAAIKAK